MKLFKVHKDIEIGKRFGNVRITTIKYSKPIESSDKWELNSCVSIRLRICDFAAVNM